MSSHGLHLTLLTPWNCLFSECGSLQFEFIYETSSSASNAYIQKHRIPFTLCRVKSSGARHSKITKGTVLAGLGKVKRQSRFDLSV